MLQRRIYCVRFVTTIFMNFRRKSVMDNKDQFGRRRDCHFCLTGTKKVICTVRKTALIYAEIVRFIKLTRISGKAGR